MCIMWVYNVHAHCTYVPGTKALYCKKNFANRGLGSQGFPFVLRKCCQPRCLLTKVPLYCIPTWAKCTKWSQNSWGAWNETVEREDVGGISWKMSQLTGFYSGTLYAAEFYCKVPLVSLCCCEWDTPQVFSPSQRKINMLSLVMTCFCRRTEKPERIFPYPACCILLHDLIV